MRAVVLLLLLVPPSCCLLGIFGNQQAVGVMGKLLCNGKPAKGVKVKLYEKEMMFDRKLAQGATDANGNFKLSGTAKEISKIDPQLNIYHKCNYKGLCYKKISIGIPTEYITKGKSANKYFDLGSMDLAMKLKGQTTDCFN
ncbi:Transthyretin-like family protein [Oesophagostomum dentatum]|uniref:Transthyretin-like family protein n=1 Tax=Oesophagostomum dentatum TaxID=61180 RepID=A0A0B1TNT1_OESDE|nr:Transthyretin-like family protein [Oesophagostomum dentatum]